MYIGVVGDLPVFVGSADRARGSLLISDSGVKEVSVGVEVEV